MISLPMVSEFALVWDFASDFEMLLTFVNLLEFAKLLRCLGCCFGFYEFASGLIM